MIIDVRPNGSNGRLLALSMFVVAMWGITAWLRQVASELAPLELTGFAMLASAAASRFGANTRGALARAPRAHPWFAWLFVSGGLAGGAGFYFAALEFAPAAQVVVVTYTWPLLFALASDVYSRRRPSVITFFSLLLGLAGVVVMNGGAEMPRGSAWIGYAGGLLAGSSWVAYSLFLQVYERPIAQDFPAFFAAAGLLALVLQYGVHGGLVLPSDWQTYAVAIVLGVGPYGLGFIAWGHVVRNGNPRVIPVLPYAVPAVAAVTLVAAGNTQASVSLFAGCGLAAMACVSALRQ
ncbi:DMT family transporter [Salinisphaera sp. SPP-AMP-43]|uniref:DMT family transporter n=1 Tax=Salinisphaera sp. SPP-AMP-43 TaxID=3121288 RepID=UPI003C6E3D6F